MDDEICGFPNHDGFWVNDDIYYCRDCRTEIFFEEDYDEEEEEEYDE